MKVLSEIATLTEALQGTSIARFGHGELAIMNGKDARLQKYDPMLAEELRSILRDSPCLVCMPHTRGKNGWQWARFLEQYGRDIPDGWYGSSFISRPDEVEWTDNFRELANSINFDQEYETVPKTNAYGSVDSLEVKFVNCGSSHLALGIGPTATVLAHRLAKRGIHAIDIGNMREFLA